MRNELLKWYLIRLLDELNQKKNWHPIREAFVDFVVDENKLIKFIFKDLFESDDDYRQRIDKVLGDCISRTMGNYIGYANPASEAVIDYNYGHVGGGIKYLTPVDTDLAVTKDGRNFIDTPRIELFLNRIPRTMAILVGGGLFAIIRQIYNLIATHVNLPQWWDRLI